METRSMKRARTSALAPATLTTLPPELIYHILEFLDNASWYRLAIAWRPFLHAYAKSLDPWNAARKRFLGAVGRERFGHIQWERLYDTMMRATKIFDRQWPVPTPSLLCALLDYMALDRHRRCARYIPNFKLAVECVERFDAWACAFGSPEVAPCLSMLHTDSFELLYSCYSLKCLTALNTFEPALRCRVVPFTTFSVRFVLAEVGGNTPRDIELFLNGLRSNETLQSLRLVHHNAKSTNDAINASIIDAVAGHVRLHELHTELLGSLSVNVLERLLRFGTVKLDLLTLDGTYPGLSEAQMTTLGAALAANSTIKTVRLAPSDFTEHRASPSMLAAFLNGYLNADYSRSVLESIRVWRKDVRSLGDFVESFNERMNGRVALSYYCE